MKVTVTITYEVDGDLPAPGGKKFVEEKVIPNLLCRLADNAIVLSELVDGTDNWAMLCQSVALEKVVE